MKFERSIILWKYQICSSFSPPSGLSRGSGQRTFFGESVSCAERVRLSDIGSERVPGSEKKCCVGAFVLCSARFGEIWVFITTS